MTNSSNSPKQLFAGEYTHGWCQTSTRRLLLKLAYHKPAGLAKHFHLMCLVDLLNHIYEDETDIIFEEYLNEDSLLELRKRRAQPVLSQTNGLMKFPPRYNIRPNAKQIQAKLDELYGMDIVEANESIPEEIGVYTDFELPDYILDGPDPSELESNVTTPSPQPPAIVERTASSRRAAAKATPAAVPTRRNSSRTNQAVTTPPALQPSSSKRGAATTEKAKAGDAELFSPPAPQRTTRSTAAGSKRRAAAPTASPSPSPRSSRSSTPAKRER